MATQRLPAVNGDDGTWGQLLIDWLKKEHVDTGVLAAGNGGHQNVTITAGTPSLAPLTFTSGTNLTTAAAGSVEYNGTDFLMTPGSTRYAIVGDTYTQTLTNKTLTTPVLNGLPTGTGVSTLTSTNTLVLRDGSGNTQVNNFLQMLGTIATVAGTTTLAVSARAIQVCTGSSTQTVVLPTTGVLQGHTLTIVNQSTGGAVTVQSSNTSIILVLAKGTSASFSAVTPTPTIPTDWIYSYQGGIFASGKSLSVSASLTLAGTDATTMTFPGSSDTIVGVAATQTLTSKILTTPTVTNPTVTDYVESVSGLGTVTTAATLTTASGTVLTATLTASTACTFTMPTAVAGKSFTLLLYQAATTGNGSATFTGVHWAAAGAPVITATAGLMDVLTFFSNGTVWYGSFVQGYTA